MVLNGIVVNKLKLPSCQIISTSLVWVFVKYSSEGPIWGPGWAEFIRLLWFWHGWEWSGKITFTCLSQISCYNQILIIIFINNCLGAGPKTWQGFLQNPLTTEEKGSKDLSERCQVLLWGMYVTSFLIGLLLYGTNKCNHTKLSLKKHQNQAVKKSRPLRKSQRSPCSWRTTSGRSYWREEGKTLKPGAHFYCLVIITIKFNSMSFILENMMTMRMTAMKKFPNRCRR